MTLSQDQMKLIKDLLPKASQDQRGHIIGKLKALDALETGGPDRIRSQQFGPSRESKEIDFLFEGIMDQMSVRGLVNLASRGSFRRTKAFKVYEAKCQSVLKVLLDPKNNIPNTTPAKLAITRLAAMCLARSLASWATVSPSLMLINVDKIPEAIESQFPGYLANGLLQQLVLRQTGTTLITPRK